MKIPKLNRELTLPQNPKFKMNTTENILNIAFLNCHGQSGFSQSKQLQIEDFVKCFKIDILHLQETCIDEESFSECRFISSNFIIIHNNSSNRYGTASLIKYNLPVKDIILHESGRLILFNIEDTTFGNVYLPSGTDNQSRLSREKFSAEVIPTLMINSRTQGMIGGDWNCIISKDDCTSYPESKMSPCLKRLVHTFSWKDDFRTLHPKESTYSRYYSFDRDRVGATRIDRSYSFGDIQPKLAKYISIAFSDHLSLMVSIKLPSSLSRNINPRSRPLFKIRPDIVHDKIFKARLVTSMKEWEYVKLFGVPVLTWWEELVKPGIKKLAIDRTKEVNRYRQAHLNLLMMRQSFLTRKVKLGSPGSLPALREIQLSIEEWFETEVQKVKHQSRVDDIQQSEKVRIYHHEIHQKHIKRSAILKLKAQNKLLEGHKACAEYLHKEVANLLLHPADLDPVAQGILLDEVDQVFTEEDNKMLTSKPTKTEVEESVKSSNVQAAPGIDGISSLVYRDCFDVLGDALTEVAQAVFNGQQPTKSQRTSLMIFTSKPGKSNSLKPEDKRKISLLNADFKTFTGIERARYQKVLSHTLCQEQLAESDDKRISFGVCLARDAIFSASKARTGCGIADNDFRAAFDFLCLDWVRKVLGKKGLADEALNRFTNIYSEGVTIPVINNILGPSLKNKRMSLRQGDRPSGVWFCYAIDPLLVYLKKRLAGILIHSLPVLGPAPRDQPAILPAIETRYTVLGYLDDCKPAITSMDEFSLVDNGCHLFEDASGCKLHRDPASNKCKFLPLGRWKGSLEQEDIPLPYLKISDHLDFLGCKLYSNYGSTRRENGEILKEKVRSQINSWKSGKFMPMTSRPWSINTFCLSKLWYRTAILDLRVGDSSTITS